MVSVLTTDFGAHPPEKWAEVTAERLIPSDSTSAQRFIATTMRLRADVMDILTKHHGAAQAHEQGMLAGDDGHFDVDHHGPTDFDTMLAEIRSAATGTPWEDHMNMSSVADAIREVVTDHTKALRHVERLWHADRNPTLEAGQAYRERFGLPASPTK